MKVNEPYELSVMIINDEKERYKFIISEKVKRSYIIL